MQVALWCKFNGSGPFHENLRFKTGSKKVTRMTASAVEFALRYRAESGFRHPFSLLKDVMEMEVLC